MVHLLNILRHGLFCLLAGSVLIDLALVGFGGGLVSASLKTIVYSGFTLMLGAMVGCIGMLMSLAVPDKSARAKVGLSIFFEIAGVACQVFDVSFIASRVCFALGWLMFLKFLEAVADSINSQKANDAIRAIFYVAGLNTFVVWLILIAWPLVGMLIFIGIWLLDVCLYGYLLFTLVTELGYYIEDIKAGNIDPSALSGNKAKPTLFNRVSSVAAPPAEEPTGPPPDGWKVCRIPKNLSPLLEAVREGENNKITAALKQGADLHEKGKNDLTPLHIAVIGGVMDVVDRLVRDGARVNEPAEHGLTPLFMAVQAGHINLVGFLISKGARLEQANEAGLTPLHWACCAPHERMKGSARVKMVETLISRGARLDARDEKGRTPRDLAEANGLKMVTSAIDRHLGVGASAVQIQEAPQDEPEGLVSGFRLEGADLWKVSGELPALHTAAKLGDGEKVNWQLASGGQVNSKAQNGLTALHIASISGVMAVADLLLKKGANVNEPSDGGLSPIYYAIQHNNAGLVGLLLTRGASLRHQNEQGRTPLHWACAVPSPKLDGQVRVKLVQMLLSKNADLNAKDQDGRTPRDLAQLAGNMDVVSAIDRHLAPSAPVRHDDDDD